MQAKPIVTVAVVAYNSAAYVIETLDSVYNQSYDRIALVISDDCSSDQTVALIQNWIAEEKHEKRFVSIALITVPKNTGVSANCNRCIAAAPSDWIKFVAGDDILLPDCLTHNMAYVLDHPSVHIVFSQVKIYQDTFADKNYTQTSPESYPNNLMHPSLSANDQYRLLLVHDRIHYTPSYFFNKNFIYKSDIEDFKKLYINFTKEYNEDSRKTLALKIIDIYKGDFLPEIDFADYWIAERESYRKNSILICYNFYKNVILVMPFFWFGIYNGFSGQLLYDPWIFQFFNVFYASLPIMLFALFDEEYPNTKYLEIKNAPANQLENLPQCYELGRLGKMFGTKVFWSWIINALGHSVILMFFWLFL